MKRVWDHTPQHTVHNTIKYFTCEAGECQGNLFKSLLIAAQFLFILANLDHSAVDKDLAPC